MTAHICYPLVFMGELGQNSMESEIHGAVSPLSNMGQHWDITDYSKDAQIVDYPNAARSNPLSHLFIVQCTIK